MFADYINIVSANLKPRFIIFIDQYRIPMHLSTWILFLLQKPNFVKVNAIGQNDSPPMTLASTYYFEPTVLSFCSLQCNSLTFLKIIIHLYAPKKNGRKSIVFRTVILTRQVSLLVFQISVSPCWHRYTYSNLLINTNIRTS